MTETSSLASVPTPSSQELVQLLVSGIRAYAIYLVDPDGRILTWNSGAEHLHGHAESEILGCCFARLFVPADAEAGAPARSLEAARQRGTYREEGWRVRKDSSRFWADVLITAIYERDGTLRGFAHVTRDETDAHAVQERLRASEEQFRLLVSSLREHALYMLDPTGLIVSWNAGAERIKQYTADEVIGRHFSIFFTTDERAANKPQRELDIAASMGVYEEEGWRVRKDGTRFWAAVVVTAVRGGDGSLTGFAKVTRDETRRHQANVDLQHALDRAREAEGKLRQHANDLEARVAERTCELTRQQETLRIMNGELEQFAYIASHDLQEPLRMVSMNLDLIERRNQGKLDDRSTVAIAKARDGAERMRALIGSLLTYARIDHAPPVSEPSDANRAYSEAVRNLQTAIEQTQATVEAKTLPTVPIEHESLVRIFQNLISNAIKYNTSPQPTVHISASRDSEWWTIRVRDNGIGMDPTMVPQIFQPFRRLHTRDEFSGTGIGLAIVKKIVEQHGGRISVDTAPGQGSCFSIMVRAI